ncbi:cytochrome P450 [Phenylobacterium sp. LjRoot219]|uniref:cytochrome P450 n=1 Tax=Phenylobacterium sp. LjRoot219 TaxID=3342283 RepID=UPI003ECFE82A
MSDALTADDPRYSELFDAAKEAAASNDGEVYGDLTPAMNALRDQAPAQKGSLRELLGLPEHAHAYDNAREHYTIFSFAACDRAFRENLLFSSEVYKESPGVRSMGKVILSMVGDEHRRYRAAAQPMFLKPKAMTWWRQNWIDEAVDALLDRLIGRDTADLNMELCARLPMHVVTRGIGMDGDKALNFRDHLLRATISRTVTMEEKMKSMAEVGRMLGELIAARRAQPADDVISGLIAAEFELAEGGTRKLTDEEIFGYCRLIMLAGGGTTWRQLGITIDALLTHGFWDACRDDRSLIPAAIEEGVRWRPTDPTFMRLTTEDVEVEGLRIPAGCRVDVCLGAANCDPSRWDDPDRYDIRRKPQNHLGFAMGPHQCLGMNVARQEMVSALNGLMDRFPNLRLDPDAAEPALVGGVEQRGMSAVPVRLA